MSDNDWLRQAAILIHSLDASTARRVLEAMEPAAARRVGRVARGLDAISLEEREAAIRAFRESRLQTAKAPTTASAKPVENGRQSGDSSVALATATDLPVELYAETLERERPQVVAAILSQLTPDRAAAVLAQLCQDLQADALSRIADLLPVSPEVHRLIAVETSQRLDQRLTRHSRREAGKAAVEAILKAAEPTNQSQLTSSLLQQDARLVSQRDGLEGTPPEGTKPRPPKRSELVFSDLRQLDDPSLALVARTAPIRAVQLALMDADAELAPRLMLGVPRQLLPVGPVLLSDIERAKQQVAQIAAQLIDEGTIVLAAGSRLAAAA